MHCTLGLNGAEITWRQKWADVFVLQKGRSVFRSHPVLFLFMCPLGWPSQALMVEQQWSALINYTTNEVKKSQYTHDSLTHTFLCWRVQVCWILLHIKCLKMFRFTKSPRSTIKTWRSQYKLKNASHSPKNTLSGLFTRILQAVFSYNVNNCLICIYSYFPWGILGGKLDKVDT